MPRPELFAPYGAASSHFRPIIEPKVGGDSDLSIRADAAEEGKERVSELVRGLHGNVVTHAVE